MAFEEIKKEDNCDVKVNKLQKNINILETILDHAYEGIIVVDKEGIIRKFNHAYEEFLGIKEEDILGRHVTDVIENTRMHLVVESGEAEVGYVQEINNHKIIASRIPIKDEGEIIGAVGKILFQDIEELRSLARRLEVLENKLNYYKSEIKRLQQAKYSFDNIISKSRKMEYLKKIARKAAESNSTVLIQGESGTGKELFAHAIHKSSHRKFGAFVRVNCAAIPRDLLESELFGYEEGAFTGARSQGKPGRFEMANGGTIFLDEIASMPLEMQAKLLRVLQEREMERVGGTETIELDVRIIAATNEDLEEKVKSGDFREDLFYRLNVIRLQIPPLRERPEDIEPLTRYILNELDEELNLGKYRLSSSALKCLQSYKWPGNVRELHNYLERAVNLTSGEVIKPHHLPDIIEKGEKRKNENRIESLQDTVARAETEAIKKAIKKADGNRSRAADLLGIHRTSLYKKINKYDITLKNL